MLQGKVVLEQPGSKVVLTNSSIEATIIIEQNEPPELSSRHLPIFYPEMMKRAVSSSPDRKLGDVVMTVPEAHFVR